MKTTMVVDMGTRETIHSVVEKIVGISDLTPQQESVWLIFLNENDVAALN